jgi:hypothetical protein
MGLGGCAQLDARVIRIGVPPLSPLLATRFYHRFIGNFPTYDMAFSVAIEMEGPYLPMQI